MILLGIIFYLSSVAFGALLSDYFFSEYVGQKIIRFAMGVPIGFAFAAYCTLLFEIIAGGFHGWLVAAASLFMLAISFYLCLPLLQKRNPEAELEKSLGELKKELKDLKLLYCGVFLISFVLIAMQYQGLHTTASGITGSDNYGVDFLFHLGIGNSLIYGPFPPRFPYAAGAINVYPFIPDFYSAILVYTGLGLVQSFYLMNFFLYFSIVAAGSYLFYRLSKNQLVPIVAMILFLFCGEGLSLIVMGAFNAPIFQVSSSTHSLLYSNLLFLITYPYFNFEMPVLNNFAPQHEYLLAFPYALTIITMLYLAFVEESRRAPNSRTHLFLGLLIGLLPLIHPETFAFLLVFGSVLFLYLAYARTGAKRKNTMMQLIKLGMVVLAVSAAEILFIHSQPLAGSLIRESITNPVWYSGGDGILSLVIRHVIFWSEVFGSIFVIGIAGMFMLDKRRVILFVPPFILLVIINFIWFPPGFGDSNKYTVYLIFLLSFASAILLRSLFKRKHILFKVFAAVLFASIIFSGVIAEYRSDNNIYQIADNVSLNASSWMVHNTNPNSIFVTNCYMGTFDYLPTIAGRKTLLDMELYTIPIGIYNYNMDNVSQAIDTLMQNADCRSIKDYNVSYLVVDKLNYMYGPRACTAVNYSALTSSPNLTISAYFSNPSANENITVFRTHCGS